MAFPETTRPDRRPGPRATTADAALLRRADAAGQRLFRELVVRRITWSAVMEASRLIAVDVVGVSLRATGCDHPPPCEMLHCFDRLEMKAMVGNHGARLPGIVLAAGAGVGGRVLQGGEPIMVPDFAGAVTDPGLVEVVAGEEGLGGVLAVPLSVGGEVRGVMHAGLRRAGEFGPGAVEALRRLCAYGGAALAAATDRLRVEEVAAARERRRLARTLHDDLGQALFGIGVAARMARESAASGRDDTLTRLHQVEQQALRASAMLRSTLRSLDDPGGPTGVLAVTLREDVAAFMNRTGVPAHLVLMGDPVPLDGVREGLAIRVVREGLRNAERHADPTEIVVTASFTPEGVELAVMDDGSGPQASRDDGSGLRALADEVARVGGDLRLGANEDLGATLRARIPAA
ncbi:MAG: histidine kinase [Actinomycetota bacterium]